MPRSTLVVGSFLRRLDLHELKIDLSTGLNDVRAPILQPITAPEQQEANDQTILHWETPQEAHVIDM